MAPKLVDVDQKKKEIIEATIIALSEKGVGDITIKDIAHNLDIGKSTIYEYFNNKDELLKQALEYFLQEHYIPEKNEEYTFMEEMELVMNRFQDHSEEELQQFNVMMDIFYHGIKGDFTRLHDVYEDYINYMAEKIRKDQKDGLLREDINPEAVSSWVGGTLDGLAFQILIDNKRFNPREVFMSFFEALKTYLTAE